MDALLDTAIKTHDGELAERVVKYVGNVNAKSGGVYVLHWAAETGGSQDCKAAAGWRRFLGCPRFWCGGTGKNEFKPKFKCF